MGRKKKDATNVVKVDVKDITEAEVRKHREMLDAAKSDENENASTQRVSLKDPPVNSPAWKALQNARQRQANALWEMYYSGELIRQRIAIICVDGSIFEKEVLFSHKSTFAV